MTEQPDVSRLTRDLAAASATMSEEEARFLVDSYYVMQENRKRSDNQVRAMTAEPHSVIAWLANQSDTLEGQIKRALDKYTEAKPIGIWMKSIYGIGPVIAAGLMAHISMEWEACSECGKKKTALKKCDCDAPFKIVTCDTAGHIWRFAGLDPTVVWNKGEKRPWNASLKTLCWKIGQSFMKFSNEDDCFYGKIYRERKAYEIQRNDSGGNAVRAAELLPKFKKSTDAYEHLSGGKLPPAQIDARARRYAVKIFLSHLQQVWWFLDNDEMPPKPFAIAHLGHVHMSNPPNTHLIPNWGSHTSGK